MSSGIEKIIKYGTKEGLIAGQVLANEPFLEVSLTKGLEKISQISSQLVGDYNLPNILCAVAIGKHFGVPEEKIKVAIENYAPSNSRSQLIKKESNTLILDAYNANPSSMKLAIENFAHLSAPHKILMLGAMMELGSESLQEHLQIIELIKKYPWDQVILVGGDFAKMEHPFLYFPRSTDAKQWFDGQKFENTHFLIKGSRSMQMEKIIG